MHASRNVFLSCSLTYRRECTLARSGKEIEEKYLSPRSISPLLTYPPLLDREPHFLSRGEFYMARLDCRTTSVKLVLIDVSLGPRLLLTPRGRNGIDHLCEMFSPRLTRRTWNNENEIDLRFRLNRNFGVWNVSYQLAR